MNHVNQGLQLFGIPSNRLNDHISSGVVHRLTGVAIDDIEGHPQEVTKFAVVVVDVVRQGDGHRSGRSGELVVDIPFAQYGEVVFSKMGRSQALMF